MYIFTVNRYLKTIKYQLLLCVMVFFWGCNTFKQTTNVTPDMAKYLRSTKTVCLAVGGHEISIYKDSRTDKYSVSDPDDSDEIKTLQKQILNEITDILSNNGFDVKVNFVDTKTLNENIHRNKMIDDLKREYPPEKMSIPFNVQEYRSKLATIPTSYISNFYIPNSTDCECSLLLLINVRNWFDDDLQKISSINYGKMIETTYVKTGSYKSTSGITIKGGLFANGLEVGSFRTDTSSHKWTDKEKLIEEISLGEAKEDMLEGVQNFVNMLKK